MKENSVLKRSLDDTQISLEINKDILFKQLSSQLKDKDKKVLKELKEENIKIIAKNKELIKEKIILEKKIYKVQQDLDDALMRNQELEDKVNTDVFLNDNTLKEKESIILQLKKELDKYYREDFNSTKELIICDPDKTKIEMNNELIETRELIGKYTTLLQREKRKTEEQKNKRTQYKILRINYKEKRNVKR